GGGGEEHLRIARRFVAGLLSNQLLHGVHEPRLAKARLADEQHDVTGALLRPLPSVLEQRELEVAPGQGRQPGRPQGLDRIAGLADSSNPEELDRMGHSSDPALAHAGAVESTSDQAVRIAAADDLPGSGDFLESKGDVARLACQGHRARSTPNDGRASVYADPRIQL